VDTLLQYHTTHGCPYSIDEITIGHCLLLATNYTSQCQDASKHFISINDKRNYHWLLDKHNTQMIRDTVAVWQVEKTNDFQKFFKRLVFDENIHNQKRLVDNNDNDRVSNYKHDNNNNNSNDIQSSSHPLNISITPDQCQTSYGKRSFLPTSPSSLATIPPMLYTFPGSGNSWCRLLVEYSTGIYSGSLYDDPNLIDVLPGEYTCNRQVSLIKVHPSAHPFKDMICCVPIPNCIKHNVNYFNRALLLIRNPFDSIWSEYQRSLFSDHIGIINRNVFNRKHWEQTAMSLAKSYTIMNKNDYFQLEQKFILNTEYIYVRYEDLMNENIRYQELKKIILFLNYTISDDRLYCAFILADQSQTHRSLNRSLSSIITKDEAYSDELICSMWKLMGRVAMQYNYGCYRNLNCSS